jgi:hypothetical protein
MDAPPDDIVDRLLAPGGRPASVQARSLFAGVTWLLCMRQTSPEAGDVAIGKGGGGILRGMVIDALHVSFGMVSGRFSRWLGLQDWGADGAEQPPVPTPATTGLDGMDDLDMPDAGLE